MWSLLADAPCGAVLESWWPSDTRSFVVRGLARTPGVRALEIFCDVPVETARRRYEARHPRHPVHGPLPPDETWRTWARAAVPLAVGPVLRLSTAVPVDPADLERTAEWARLA
jgi:hypothetical protein